MYIDTIPFPSIEPTPMASPTLNNPRFITEEDSLALYLKEIGKNKPLSFEEESKLAVLIRKNDRKALEKLVSANLRFVVSVSKNYQNQGLPLTDMISEGNLGLIRAAKRFDEKKKLSSRHYIVSFQKFNVPHRTGLVDFPHPALRWNSIYRR